MADNMIKFYRGALANLPEAGTLGAMYITTDEGAIYYGTGTGMKRLGDFVQVADVASLPVSGANESALYYCAAENVLAKWNGTSWSQINKDTGMTSVEVTGSGNAVTSAVYSADGRKLTLTKGETFATKAALDELDGRVGSIPEEEAYKDITTIVGYINKKAEETLNAASGGSSESAASVLAALNTYKTENNAAVAANKTAAENAQAAADQAQGEVDALETVVSEYKTANDAAVAAAQKAGDDAQADVDALAGKVGAVPEDKTVVQMIADAQTAATYDDKEVRELIADNAEAIEALEGVHAEDKEALEAAIELKADKSVVDGILADYLTSEDETAIKGLITAEENARKAADEALEGRLEKVETFFELAEGEKLDEAKDTLIEIQKLIDEDAAAADIMVKDIAANKVAHEANAKAISDEAKAREDADKALSDRIDGLHTHENLEVLNGITAEKVAAWDAAQVNVIETIKVNGEELEVKDKAVEIAIPTGELASKDEVAKANLAEALAAELDAKAVAADVETELGKKVDKVEGKSLVLDTEITKLAGVSEGANKVEASETNGNIKINGVETVVYTHPAEHAIGEITGLEDVLATKLEASDIADKADKATTLAGYGIADAYTKAEIEALLTWGSF